MAETTLESLVKRIEAIEAQLVERASSKPEDWRSVVGIFDDDPEFMQQVLADVLAQREAERVAAREGTPE